MQTVEELTPQQLAERRRRIRRNALLLTAFAVVVYVGFIVSFIKTHS
jgi:hypothetical protein